MKKLSKHDLIDKLDTMLIYTIADIDVQYGESETGETWKKEIRQAYKQIKELIEKKPEENLLDIINKWPKRVQKELIDRLDGVLMELGVEIDDEK